MKNLDICAAQYCSVAGNLSVNIERHLQFMQFAAKQGVAFLIFPELSLTGYEISCARELAQAPDTAILQPLHELAKQLEMTTVVGLPLCWAGSDTILIGSLIFAADGSQGTYTKQHLHLGEETVFSSGNGGALLNIGSEHIALSICADFTHASHVQTAAKGGAGVYATSVLISDKGYQRDSDLLKGYAQEHSLGVLMANHGAPSGGWTCAGRSAFWAPGGKMVVSAASTGDCLVIARRRHGLWQGETVECSVTP